MFMECVVLFGVGFSTGLSGAMIPGPLVLYTVSEAFHRGQLVGIQIALGHLLLEACFAVVVIMGLRDFLSSAPFRLTVVWVGGIGLVVMGGLILAQVRHFSLAQRAQMAFRWGPLVGGAFFSVISPGFLIWWATIGVSVFLQGALSGGIGITMVAVGHAVADLVWCWFIAFSVERGRSYCSDRTYRLIMALIALCLIGIGLTTCLSPFR
jgi:threonine/homoserine/homoserine lactone efflux protein